MVSYVHDKLYSVSKVEKIGASKGASHTFEHIHVFPHFPDTHTEP